MERSSQLPLSSVVPLLATVKVKRTQRIIQTTGETTIPEAYSAPLKELNYGKYGYIVEADIKGYFQNINHEKLMEMLSHDIADKPFLKLINKWLKAGIMTEENIVEKPYKGTAQGGVISPVLANIYLHYVLDMWFEKVVKLHVKGESMMISYADDFVCAFRYKSDAERFMVALERRFNKFGLELSKEKTKLIKFSRFSKERKSIIAKDKRMDKRKQKQ